jgi:hypothetical protein
VKRAGIGIGIVIVGLITFIVLRPAPVPVVAASLADGTQIIVQGVTYGTNHHFFHGSKFLHKVKPYLPGFINRWLPDPLATMQNTSQGMLLLWYSAYQPATGKYIQVPVEELNVIDEHGCAFRANDSHGSRSTATFTICTAYISIFPRRQKSFILRAKFAKHPAVDLQISNPVYPMTAEWTAEALPAVRQTNDLTVKLAKLRFSTRRSSTFEYADVSPEISVLENGVKRDDWYAHSQNYRDATGNSSRNGLCPHERAWKMELDLYKTDKAPFPESAIWRVSDLTLPGSGGVTKLTAERGVGGMTVRTMVLCGAGDFTFSNEVCIASSTWKEGAHESFSTRSSGYDTEMKFASKNPSLLVRVDGWHNFPELLIRARTSESEVRSLRFTGSGNNLYRFELDRAMLGAQPFEVEFIRQQPMRFEFMVEPPRAGKARKS